MNLILVRPGEIGGDGALSLVDERARHLIQTLKAAPGQDVRIGVIDGPRGVGRVTAVEGGRVDLHCTLEPTVPEPPRVSLLLALPRPKVMRRLWAQLAALGVDRIILTNAERVERNYFDTHVITEACYGPLLVEGLQQARDTRLPRVSIHRQFKVLIEDALDGLFPAGRRLVAHPGAAPLLDVLRSRTGAPPGGERVLLSIGPEGGWNDYELRLLERHGFEAIGMGERTLRTDTACVALLALVHEAQTAERRP